jgi:hypothetical protein
VAPTVVAPGDVVSARTNSLSGTPSCGTIRYSGTSMATPVIAGSLALMRQYFMEGRHVGGGTPVPAARYTPSGPLLKAVLLAGAVSLRGNTESQLPLEPAPSFRQGFGRINLTSSLPLSTTPNMRLQVRAGGRGGEGGGVLQGGSVQWPMRWGLNPRVGSSVHVRCGRQRRRRAGVRAGQ